MSYSISGGAGVAGNTLGASKPWSNVALREMQGSHIINRKVKSVRALERGLDVLIELQNQNALSLQELHERLGLPKATLLRMLVTLSSRGFVWQRLADGAFLPAMFRDAVNSWADVSARLAEVASPLLERLSKEVALPSVLAVPRLDHLEIIETNSSLLRLDAAALGPVGARISYIHTATGRAYLAACDENERAAIIGRLRPDCATPASEAALRAILDQTQTRGYSLREPRHLWPDYSRSNVAIDGRRSVAVPVLVRGVPIAAINLTWVAHRPLAGKHFDSNVSRLQKVAIAIGRSLGAEVGGL